MKKIKTWMLLIAVALVTNMAVSCNEEDLPDNYYTATEMTAAGFLQNDPEVISLLLPTGECAGDIFPAHESGANMDTCSSS